jgi:signal transduction histidine kinase
VDTRIIQRRLSARSPVASPASSQPSPQIFSKSRPARLKEAGLAAWTQGVRLEALANLAHELRSPLQALLGYIEMLRDELGVQLDSEPRQIIERMNVNAHDLAQTVENVMDFSLAQADAEDAVEEHIRVMDLIGDLAPALEAANDNKGLKIGFDLDDAPKMFRGRLKPLKAILLNLAVNAIKFTEVGSVTIVIRSADFELGEPAIEFEISDTGPGIEAGLIVDAFKRCTQLSSSSIRKYRGAGLGLAVVQRNVAALGATLSVDSNRTRGTTFKVRVPLNSPVECEAPAFC